MVRWTLFNWHCICSEFALNTSDLFFISKTLFYITLKMIKMNSGFKGWGMRTKENQRKKINFFCVHFKTEMHHLRIEEDEDEQRRSQNKMRRKTFSMIKLASSYEL